MKARWRGKQMSYSVMTIMRSLRNQIEALIFDNEYDLMTAANGLKTRLQALMFFLRYRVLPLKQRTELYYWNWLIKQCTKWYQGELHSLYEHPTPSENEKVTDYSLKENALRTWTRVDSNKYLDHLLVPADYFKGMNVLDIGCGPIPYALVFTGCRIFGLDQLIEFYRNLGYPIDGYSDRLVYIKGSAERIPVDDGFFDAVVSVNAIDHVDDFGNAAKEVSRVLKSGGILRFEAHYHKPTVCEPWRLNDDLVLKHFRHLGIKKICQRDATELHYDPSQKGEKLVIWANRQ
jgi:SAM-dependent methyltransferase